MEKLVQKLEWMRRKSIWPNGLRYLWTDAHGICALLNLYYELQDDKYLAAAESLVGDVYKVLGRKQGLRIGEAPDRDGQYYHYLTKWLFALNQLGKLRPEYHERAVALAQDIHKAFVVPCKGVNWKMLEDLSGPYPGHGYGGLDHYDGYVQYKLLDSSALSSEIGDLQQIVNMDYQKFSCTQDLGVGESLWTSHFFPDEPWAGVLRQRCVKTLDKMWVKKDDTKGYFCRFPEMKTTKYAFTNFGISYGLQAAGVSPDRVEKLNNFFESYKSGDEYDMEAITHVMHMNSLFPGVLCRSYTPK